MNEFLVPIILINWNGIEDTMECIQSLLDMESNSPAHKIYLLDNGSNEIDVKLLKQNYGEHHKIELIFNDTNIGFAKGCNQVVQHVNQSSISYEYLVLLNNDTTVDECWLSELVHLAKQKKAGIVSSKMINYYNPAILDNVGHKMLNTAEIVPIGYEESVDQYTTDFQNLGACAGAALYTKKLIDDIGFFDSYFSTGYEDAELGVRAFVSGYSCWYASKAKVYHKVSRSVSKIFDYDYLLHIQKNIFYAYLKLMPRWVVLISLPFLIMKYSIVALVDILFWRPKYLKILVQTFKESFWDDLEIILNARKAFFNSGKKISSIRILAEQEFFLWFDIKRFFKYVVFRKKSEFDKIKEKKQN